MQSYRNNEDDEQRRVLNQILDNELNAMQLKRNMQTVPGPNQYYSTGNMTEASPILIHTVSV